MTLIRTSGSRAQVENWWLSKRQLVVLWRGQTDPTSEILSPIARSKGLAASQALYDDLIAAGVTRSEIAYVFSRFHSIPVSPPLGPPGFPNTPVGGVAIPTSRLAGIARGYAKLSPKGVVYLLRVPKRLVTPAPSGNMLAAESEFILFNQIPRSAVIRRIPASKIPTLSVDEMGRVVHAVAYP